MQVAEVRQILSLLTREAGADVAGLWRTAEGMSSGQFRAYIIDAFPEVVLPYSASAADVGVELYESSPTTSRGFTAVQGDTPPAARLATSAEWALNTGNATTALTLLNGVGERAVMDGLRSSILTNVDRERGARWARHASANACPFCRMLATRDDYLTEKTAGFKSHDSCHCIPTPVRPGGSADRPAYIDKWTAEYNQARKDAGSGDTTAILNAWERSLR